MTFADNGDGTATLAGTPAGGSYTFGITALNAAGGSGQTFTLVVTQPPALVGMPTARFFVGGAGSVALTATGFPAPALSLAGALPAGVTVGDHGDGSATLAGTPEAGTAGTYSVTLTAANGIGTADTQSLALVVVRRVEQNEFGQFVASGGASAVPLNPDGSAFGAAVAPFGPGTTRAVLADVTGDGAADLVVAVPTATGARVVSYRGTDLTGPGLPPVFRDYSGAIDPLLSGVFVG